MLLHISHSVADSSFLKVHVEHNHLPAAAAAMLPAEGEGRIVEAEGEAEALREGERDDCRPLAPAELERVARAPTAASSREAERCAETGRGDDIMMPTASPDRVVGGEASALL